MASTSDVSYFSYIWNANCYKSRGQFEFNSRCAILIDAETGKILYEENADTPLGIASMTKMMTEYILFEAIKEGKITWDQQYKVTIILFLKIVV